MDNAMSYTNFAQHHGLSVNEAMTLPALFERMAEKLGITIQQCIIAVNMNEEAGKYIAETARVVCERYFEEVANDE